MEASDTNMGCMMSSNATNEVTNNNRNECPANVVSLANPSDSTSTSDQANASNPVNADANDITNANNPDNSSDPADTIGDQCQLQPPITTQAAMDTAIAAGGMDAPLPPPEGGESKPAEPSPVCTFCYSVPEAGDIVKPQCDHIYCSGCIKTMFLTACKDESNMPPRCCRAIPIGIALPFLTNDEAALFREKFEEWHTTDRLYCPVPTCSAFIPNRLLPTPPASPKQVSLEIAEATEQPQTDNASAGNQSEECAPAALGTDAAETLGSTPMQLSDSSGSHASNVSCPKCDVAVCVRCKRLSHPHTPCQGEDESVTAFLRKFKLKRCPKCRNAVKKMFGCDHVRCRCGAQWCWTCCKRIDVCENDGCYGEDYGQIEDAEDDLDAGSWHQGDFQNIGDEPDRNIPDPFNCDHYWERVRWVSGTPEWRGLECHRCLRELQADPRVVKPVVAPEAAPADTDTVMTGTEESQQTANKDTADAIEVDEYSIAFRCYCSLFVCRSCIRRNEQSAEDV